MFSQGWYIPRVTQFSRITIILTRSNHVAATLVKVVTGSFGIGPRSQQVASPAEPPQ